MSCWRIGYLKIMVLKRHIDYDSVYLMDGETYPETFENVDYGEDYYSY